MIRWLESVRKIALFGHARSAILEREERQAFFRG